MTVGTSEAVTQGVVVSVKSAYVPERSMPAADKHFFVYHVTIANRGDTTVQLVSRHWVINDGRGDIQEVRGLGVVGKQPRLEPGEAFEYTSFCPLTTSIGSMEGTFQMVDDEGTEFDARIETFTLAAPYALN